MEARAKQRLTGAIILVALFVLLVPELLTGPRDSHPPTENGNDDGLHRYTIDLDARNGSNPSTPSASSQPAVALPAVPSASNSTLATPGEAAAPEGATPKAPSPATTAPTNPASSVSAPNHVAATVPTPTPTQTPLPVPSTATSPPRTVTPPRTERVNPPAADSVAKSPAAAGGFVVQLGTFGKRENADRLVRDMTAKGFTAFVVPTNTNGHELFRVRVGPARDRAAAEALAAQLKHAGQSGSIVPIS